MILTVNDLKPFLGVSLTDTAGDTVLLDALTKAYKNAEQFCGRTFDYAASITEYISRGKTIKEVRVKRLPIVSVTSLTINETDLVADEDYYLDDLPNGVITLENSWSIPDVRAVKIVYAGGWSSTTFPEDLKRAIFMDVIRNKRIAGTTLVSQDAQLINFSKAEIEAVYMRYKRFEI